MTPFVGLEAPGAWPIGTRVRKAKMRKGDAHGVGACATVIGSVGPVEGIPEGRFGYMLCWEDMPNVAVFCADGCLELAPDGA